MRKTIAVLATLCALAFAGTAGAGITFGVSDDWAKFHPCGDVFWQSMRDIGYTQLRMTVQWDATNPTAIPYQANIQAAVDCAAANGVSVVLAVYPAKPSAIGSSDAAQQSFASFVALVGQAFPGVKTFVVGNEPNVNRFWQPQYVNGQDAAAKDYEHTLAYAYDKLKVVRPDSLVWGPAISSRGNDDANAASNPSHSPVVFIHELAAAYRASGRTKPIFDGFDMHPYPPVQDTAPFSRPFDWPQGGAANLDRIETALADGFQGTAQWPSAGQIAINLDEAGEQTDVKTSPHAAAYTYSGPENVKPIDEATQANNYVELAHIAECWGTNLVGSLFYFPLIDDTDILGYQSGQLYADAAHKASYAAMKQEIAASNGGRCHGAVSGVPTSWVRDWVEGASESVVGGAEKPAGTGTVSFAVRADEDANFRVTAVINVGNKTSTTVLTGSLKAHHTATVTAPTGVGYALAPKAFGHVTVDFAAASNPLRTAELAPLAFVVDAGAIGSAPVPAAPPAQPSVSGSTTAFSAQDAKELVQNILTLLRLPDGSGLARAQTLLFQLAQMLGPMKQNGFVSMNLLTDVDTKDTVRLPASVQAKPKKAKLPSFKVRFTKGKTVKFPTLAKIPVGTYRMQLVFVGASGARLTLKTATFSVDAKGRLTRVGTKPAAKKAAPTRKKKTK